MERILERVKDAARLALIVGVAVVNLGLAACGGSRVPVDASPDDAHSPPRDATARPDAGPPADGQPPPPDAKLWDVLCE